jgi:hypothetical protein
MYAAVQRTTAGRELKTPTLVYSDRKFLTEYFSCNTPDPYSEISGSNIGRVTSLDLSCFSQRL